MDTDLVGLILKAFGPAGGLAILLLAVSVWANWKLFLRINKMHDASVNLEINHTQELGKCRLECEKEKAQFKGELERRYQEQLTIFLDRDNLNRKDIGIMFTRFEKLMDVVTVALSRLTESMQNLRDAIKDGPRRKT